MPAVASSVAGFKAEEALWWIAALVDFVVGGKAPEATTGGVLLEQSGEV